MKNEAQIKYICVQINVPVSLTYRRVLIVP
jgi:hypothetical protein